MSSNYKLERETSTSSVLSFYILSSPILSPQLSTSINSLSFYYNMSQHSLINLEQIVWQQQEQVATLQILITQARLEWEEITALWPNTRSNIEVAKLQTFNEEANKVLKFLTAYKFFIRIKIRNKSVEK